MPETFYEDMGRKAEWFREIHGTNDRKYLDQLRNRALQHVEVMRVARVERLDPGCGPITKSSEFVGATRQTKLDEVSLPEVGDGVFVTRAVKVQSSKEELAGTLKQRLRRGAQVTFDPRTARMFRYDEGRESWRLVNASGWNAKDKYVWGRVDRPGIYVAVALPKERSEVRRLSLEFMSRRMIRDAVATGHFASAADLADRGAFRDYLVDVGHLDVRSRKDRTELATASKAHVEMTR